MKTDQLGGYYSERGLLVWLQLFDGGGCGEKTSQLGIYFEGRVKWTWFWIG